MSAETVTTKIEEKARLAAQAIIAEAKEKAEAERKAILDDTALRVEKMLEGAKLNAEIAEKGRVQIDAMNIKLGILDTKRQILSEVKSEAKSKLINMSEDNFVEIFSKYISSSKLSGEFELIPSALHRAFCKGAVKSFEKCADIKIKLSKTDADIDSGFILSSENYDVEFSLDAMLDEVLESQEKAVADILFETGDVK